MIKAILFDVSGVLHVDGEPVSGAVEALCRVRRAGFAIRYVTNTSRQTSQETLQSLIKMGFEANPSEVFTAAAVLKQVLQQRCLRPYCLIHHDLLPEFADVNQKNPNAVVVADAAEGFSYQNMNRAFQLIMDGAPLIGIGLNRYFRQRNQLLLDAGPFITALEYACDIEAEIIGKPAPAFFHAAVASTGFRKEQVLMVGDDAFADVDGALASGLRAILVQTGKYAPGDETTVRHPGASTSPSVVEVAQRLIAQRESLK